MDRTRQSVIVSAFNPRVAESWSNVREHGDRTWFRATVDIREREDATESWSGLREQVDRIRIERAATQTSLSWTSPAVGGVAISAASIALLLSAPAAFADPQPQGPTPAATAGQAIPTASDTTATTSTTDSGTPASSQSTLGHDNGNGNGNGGNGNSDATQSTDGSSDVTGSPPKAHGPPPADGVENPPSSNAQDAESEANANQSGAQNGNVSVRVDKGGNSGNVTQGNDASSSASSTATGNLPASGSDPTANASATTAQDSPSNTNVTVRVDSPGDIAPVGQKNHADADASAKGSNAPDGNGGGGKAAANATQSSPDNINVVVRVGSPGDNGDVTQENTVEASAGPDVSPTPVDAVTSGGPAETDQLVETAGGRADASNHGTVEQQLIQTQDGPGPEIAVSGDDVVVPADSSSTGSATATQTGAQNINVSIRVGSPGHNGRVSQANGASAAGTRPDLSIATVVGDSNLDLAIDLPGSTSRSPGDNWTWNWTWTSAGTPSAGATAATAAPTDGPTWNWSWMPAGVTAPATTTATTTTTTGFFTWTWTWTTMDGNVWSLTQQQACDCNWAWNWTWDWSSGAPVTPAATEEGEGSTPQSTPGDDGPVSQSNTVSATAAASAEVTATGLLYVAQDGFDPALELQDAENGQSFTNVQTVVAVAEADQLDPWNANSVWGVPFARVTQSNVVAADASANAVATLGQELIQGQFGSEDTYQWVGAQQTAINDQQIAAGAVAVQDSAGNANIVSAPEANQAAVGSVEQGNAAGVTATATATAALYQGLAQFEDAVGSGVELIDLAQLVDSYQFALVAAAVAQTRTQNVNALVVPAGSRATNPTVRQRNIVTASVSSENTGNLTSVAFQYQGGAADIELTSGSQQIQLVQAASASGHARQSDLLNYASWLGVEPPFPPADDGGDGEAGADPPGPGTTRGSSPPPSGLTRVNGPFRPSSLDAAPPAPKVAPVLQPKHLVPASASGRSAFAPPRIPAASPAPVPTVATAVPGIAIEPSPGPAPRALVRARAHVTQVTSIVGPAQSPSPWLHGFPDNPFSAGTGTSGSAPSSGSGQTVLAFGAYKLAAQLVTGPQMPTSVLGRPVIFLDPFERPG